MHCRFENNSTNKCLPSSICKISESATISGLFNEYMCAVLLREIKLITVLIELSNNNFLMFTNQVHYKFEVLLLKGFRMRPLH
jgi:hypothetical protein